jgi:large subunit ribosomal protein L18
MVGKKMKRDSLKRLQRHTKVRKKISGTNERPRVAIFRSAQHIYAQIIDDMQNKTLAAESDLKLKTGKKAERATQVGELLAKKALSQKITKVVFDRGGFLYHGRVKALADGLRKGGLEF